MEKCSMSPAPAPAELLLLSLEVRARYRRGQAASLSTGDGGRYTPLSLTTGVRSGVSPWNGKCVLIP